MIDNKKHPYQTFIPLNNMDTAEHNTHSYRQRLLAWYKTIFTLYSNTPLQATKHIPFLDVSANHSLQVAKQN